MKNKFETIKEEVLSLHKSQKTEKMILREQAGDLKSKLQSFLDNGQVPDAVGIAELETSNPNRRFAIKKKSKKNPGTFVYLFLDFKYGSFGADGKFSYGPGVWVPKQPKDQIIDRDFKNAEVESYKTKFGAKTKEEAIQSGWDLTNLKKVTIQGVDLYIPMSNANVVTGVSQQQKDAIKDLKQQYSAKEWHEMTGAEQQNWQEIPIPAERLFGAKVKLYRDPLQDMKLDTKDYKTASDNYTIGEKECVQNILQYFEDYRADKPMRPSYFQNFKPKVQYCKNVYHNRWGLRPNAGKLNKILDLMSREISEFQGVSLPPSFPVEGSNRHQWLLKNI
jgi:hypothetical protein